MAACSKGSCPIESCRQYCSQIGLKIFTVYVPGWMLLSVSKLVPGTLVQNFRHATHTCIQNTAPTCTYPPPTKNRTNHTSVHTCTYAIQPRLYFIYAQLRSVTLHPKSSTAGQGILQGASTTSIYIPSGIRQSLYSLIHRMHLYETQARVSSCKNIKDLILYSNIAHGCIPVWEHTYRYIIMIICFIICHKILPCTYSAIHTRAHKPTAVSTFSMPSCILKLCTYK